MRLTIFADFVCGFVVVVVVCLLGSKIIVCVDGHVRRCEQWHSVWWETWWAWLFV